MRDNGIGRRAFLKRAGLTTLGAAAVLQATEGHAQRRVPNSSGTDAPRLNETDKPDDAVLFDLLAAWAPSEATHRRILVDNPETLHGFTKSL